MPPPKGERDIAVHAQPGDDGAFDRQVIQQSGQVVGVLLQRGLPTDERHDLTR